MLSGRFAQLSLIPVERCGHGTGGGDARGERDRAGCGPHHVVEAAFPAHLTTLGAQTQQGVTILSGLSAGERLAAGDLSQLKDGDRVRIEPAR
jgi:hypothetical protein